MVTALPELPPPTDRLGDLTEGEQLVLNCFRRWLAGPGHREVLWRSLAREIEPDRARTALKGLEAAIRVLTAHATRNITYHRPCCPCVGPDEVALLTLVTAVQRDEPELARLVARSFVPHDRVSLILAAIDLFASALKRAAIELPLRFAYCAEGEIEGATAEMAPAPTIH